MVEVLIALAVLAISLVPLLQLLVSSIFVDDAAQNLSSATLIAENKLAEIVAQGKLKPGQEKTGIVQCRNKEFGFNFRVKTAEAVVSELEGIDLPNLNKLTATVTWSHGKGKKQISLTMYVYHAKTIVLTQKNAAKGLQ